MRASALPACSRWSRPRNPRTPRTTRDAMSERRPVQRVGVYPGTFDPITNGHVDIIARAARMLDKLVVGVAVNAGKGPLFPADERVELVRAELEPITAR